MALSRRPRVGIFAGDPTGIGPEITAALLAEPETHNSAEIVSINAPEEAHWPTGRVSRDAGAYSLAALANAAAAMRTDAIDAFVYAPLNKQAMKLAGLTQEDEMHFLVHELGYRGLCAEINVAANLWTTRVTSHVPLCQVAGLIREQAVFDAILLLDRTMRPVRATSPRIAVAGLNPHAGEGGLLGHEEIDEIAPAVVRARAEGIEVSGPYPADTLFIAARRGDFDAVVTMYHDQGQIAMKLMGFEKGVTLHAGLPKPVATPAHGTAFDIAGKGVANIAPLREAFRLAVRLI